MPTSDGRPVPPADFPSPSDPAPAASAASPAPGAAGPEPESPGSPTPPASPETPGPASQATPAPPRAESRVGHFVKWFLALAGVVIALIAIETAGMFAVMAVVASVGGVSAVSSLSSVTDDPFLYMALNLVLQLIAIAVVVPWWCHVRKRAIGLGRGEFAVHAGLIARRVTGIVFLALGVQVVTTCAVNVLLPLFPDVMSNYEELMETAGVSQFTVTGVISTVCAAPVLEELVFRGIALQFALRAVCMSWRRDGSGGDVTVSDWQFWVANVLQALAFGVMHLNITQGLYAFFAGLLLGWVFWRTGKLRWSMGLHAAFNLSSYAVDAILVQSGLSVAAFAFAIAVVLIAAGVAVFARATDTSALAFESPRTTVID